MVVGLWALAAGGCRMLGVIFERGLRLVFMQSPRLLLLMPQMWRRAPDDCGSSSSGSA